MFYKLTTLAIVTGMIALAGPVAAQYRSYGYQPRPPTYYAPRVYQSPQGSRPWGSQAGWSALGSFAGGSAAYAASRGNTYWGNAGAAAGAYYGGQLYNSWGQSQRYYYYPQPYGMQTTTPYMVRPGY